MATSKTKEAKPAKKKSTSAVKTQASVKKTESKAKSVKTAPQAQVAKKKHHFKWKPSDMEVREVHVAGDFSNWTPIPLVREVDVFVTSVELPSGEYQYKFIVDGEWCEDPDALMVVQNEFGTTNCIIRV